MGLKELRTDLRDYASAQKAKDLQRFFKTGKGEYGEGDVFLGVMVPDQRTVSKKHWQDIDSNNIQELLDSKFHEERLAGLLCLIEKYKHSNSDEKRKAMFDFYLRNVGNGRVNNWDLVDLSAPNIVGDFLSENNDRKILYLMANSDNLWKKRVAIISTATFIRLQQFDDTLKIANILINDSHDLIHKAVGWMLREVGKKDSLVLENYLKQGNKYKTMPRTMLRYSIEKFDEETRKRYLDGKI